MFVCVSGMGVYVCVLMSEWSMHVSVCVRAWPCVFVCINCMNSYYLASGDVGLARWMVSGIPCSASLVQCH